MYDYISPEKVLTALRQIKQSNLLYSNTDINEEWLEQAMSNNEDLFAGMVEQSAANEVNIDANSEPAQQSVDEPRHDSTIQPVGKDSLPSGKDTLNDFTTILKSLSN